MSVQRFKYLILGAGPSGLAFAHGLLRRRETSFLVLEKESHAGGLCRSLVVDGAPLDIGGGHFLDVRRKNVLQFLFEFMPKSEWCRFSRVAKIWLHGAELDHPLEANLWQLPADMQPIFIRSLSLARARLGEPMPTVFGDWICWKFGTRIAHEYMLPYNRKLWRRNLNELGTYWLHKLPDVSFGDSMLSFLQRKAQGSLAAHGVFLYPIRHGYGEVWRRMGEALGNRLLLNTNVHEIDISSLTVNRTFRADRIVNTIPWASWSHAACFPAKIKDGVSRLVHASIDVDYVPDTPAGEAHWIYEPDERIDHHRIICRPNFSPGSRGCSTETNARVSKQTNGFRHRNEFAYPVNTIDKPAVMNLIESWAAEASILPLGRWGKWAHMNSDVAVAEALKAAEVP